MFKRVSLRWRLTLLNSLLTAICCIGLSAALNDSAYRMADTIDAMIVQPGRTTADQITEVPVIPIMPSQHAEQAKHGYFRESMLYTLTAVIVSGLLTYWISGKALKPLNELNEQVKKINANNLENSIPIPKTKDEIAEMTISFNEMTAKLAQGFAVQKRFSADAAHELRTPLTILQTKLDVFQKKENHTPQEYQMLTETFQKQISRMRSLVSQLLNIANLEHRIQKEEFSLKSLLEEIEQEMRETAKEKQICIRVFGPDCFIWGEIDLLYRAFYNLTENAVKYNHAGGRVELGIVKVGSKKVTVSVCDTGIGIPESLKTQIFEPFFRVDQSRTRSRGGTGLGLALTASIVQKHNGIITVSDQPEGGTCFSVTLPIGAAQPLK